MALPTNANVGYVSGWFMDGAGTVVAGVVTFTPSPVKVDDDTAAGHPVTILPKAIKITLGGDGGIPTTAAATAAGKIGQELLSSEDLDLRPSMWTWQASFEFVGVGNPPPFSFSLPVDGQVNLTTAAPLSSAGGTIIVQGVPSGGADGQILAKASATSYDTEWIDAPTGGGGGAVSSVAGKTGAVTLVKADVGLGSVDNTTDAAKPVSTPTQTALNLKANAANAALTGTPTVPTAAPGTNTTQAASTAFVTAAVAAGGGGGGAVDSVNGATGVVVLDATDIGALPDTYAPAWDDVTSKPAVIASGATATIARDAIAAGTSNLAIGTTGSTAMAGNKTAADLGGIVSNVTGIAGAFALPNIVGISQVDYDALTDPETTYPNVTFLVLS